MPLLSEGYIDEGVDDISKIRQGFIDLPSFLEPIAGGARKLLALAACTHTKPIIQA